MISSDVNFSYPRITTHIREHKYPESSLLVRDILLYNYESNIMIKNPPDDRLVYLALKNVFKGPDAKLRRPQKIRKQIQKHRKKAEVHALITEHSMENVCKAAKTLLENGIFASTLRAEIRFLGVFDISPA